MTINGGSTRHPINQGHEIIERGWKPTVQGGYKPTASGVVAAPPKGGSGIKAPPKQ